MKLFICIEVFGLVYCCSSLKSIAMDLESRFGSKWCMHVAFEQVLYI